MTTRAMGMLAAALALTLGCVSEGLSDGDVGQVEEAGTTYQGTTRQGTTYQGTTRQGTTYQGTTRQGMAFGGTSFTGTINGTAIEGWVGMQYRRPLSYTQYTYSCPGYPYKCTKVATGTYYASSPTSSASLTGTQLTSTNADGTTTTFRIAAVYQDIYESTSLLADPGLRSNSDVYLYHVQMYDSGTWRNVCTPDAGGSVLATAVKGVWSSTGSFSDDGTQFSFACVSGVIAKCARWGYKPWRTYTTPKGATYQMQSFHLACTRAAMGDYCGTGTTHTQDGTLVDIADAAGFIWTDPNQDGVMVDEASFGVSGAGCLRTPRYYNMPAECPSGIAGANRYDAGGLTNCLIASENGQLPTQWIYIRTSTYCSHSWQTVGNPLDPGCNSCAARVCQSDPYCCEHRWDSICVSEASAAGC